MNILISIYKKIKNIFHKKYARKLNKTLDKLVLNDDTCKITLVDVGAAGDIEPRWKSISSNINYIGFEPDKRSYDLLKKKKVSESYTIYNTALWDSECKIKINLTREPKVSSYYSPNDELLKLYSNKERFIVDKVIEIDAVSLDSLKFKEINFIKIDTQGGELKVLEGSKESLDKCLGLEVEVEFLEMYKNQPLFGDVTKFLKNEEFEFIDFTNLCRWEREEFNGFGHCVFGDGLFLRSPEWVIKKHKESNAIKLKYLGICLIYNRIDLIDRLIELSNYEFKALSKPFLNSISYFRKKNLRLKFINKIYSTLISVYFKNARSHVIY